MVESSSTLYSKVYNEGFISAEGRYKLVEDIFLGENLYPSSNPNNANYNNVNNSVVNVSSITNNYSVGTSISLVTVKFNSDAKDSKETLNLKDFTNGNGSNYLSDDNGNEENGGIDKGDDLVPPPTPSSSSFSLFNKGNKLKKTMSSSSTNTVVNKPNSTLVQKIVKNDKLQQIKSNAKERTFAFYNLGKTFVWVDINYPNEPLSQMFFNKAYPTCHDVNKLTRANDHLDVVIGFSTGDIVIFDPLTNKYNRVNKQGIINSTLVTSIQWVPGSENLILASFFDGSLILFDKDKDDNVFQPLLPTPTNTLFMVTKPSQKVTNKSNPQFHWQVSNKSIPAFAFSPDFQLVAVVSLDGGLRIIDYNEASLKDVYSSYFGGLTCVAWSPDHKYLLTGGQDDLVSVWSSHDKKLMARCQGHRAWVTGVQFDSWRCDGYNYRFGSVGDDCQLLLWDFSPKALPKSKQRNRRGSQSQHSLHSTLTADRHPLPQIHPPAPRIEVPILKPIVAQAVHLDPLCTVVFKEDAIITTGKKGRIKVWARPTFNSQL